MFENSQVGIGAMPSQAASNAPVKTSEVSRELDILESAIANLRNSLERTYKRLNPILANIPVATGCEKPCDPSCNTDIGKAIKSKRLALEEMNNAVLVMFDRIEV